MSKKDETYEEIFFDVSLRRIEALIKKWQEYNPRASRYSYPKKENTFYWINKSVDYEGSPCNEWIDLECLQGDVNNITKAAVVWKVTIEYQSTYRDSDIYDYTAIVREDRSTAYKMSSSGPPKEVKFRLINLLRLEVGRYNLNSPRKIPTEQLQSFYDDLVYLEKAFLIADELTKDIETWVSSGMGIRISCSCHRHVNLSNRRLSEFFQNGLTLEHLKQRLKCQKCGERPYKFLPPDDELNELFLNRLKD